MRRATALAGGLLAAGLTWVAAPASAGDVTTGSWTQLRSTTPLGDSPDLQTTDGDALPVSNGFLGPLAIAAIRFPSAAATLELTRVDPASAAPTSALPALPVPPTVVWACPATRPWQAGARQPWGSRPAYDCSRHAVGNVTAGGMFWDLTGLADNRVDLVLVPVPGDTTSYSLTFAAPTASSFQTVEPAVPPPAEPPLAPVEEPVAPVGTVGSAQEPVLPVVPLSSPLPTAPPAVVAPAPRTSVPQAVPVREVADAAPRWVGPALLAFLALLLMAKAALPAAATGDRRSLVVVRTEGETP